MLTTFWSVKGGSGTTVVAASHALQLVRARRPTLLVDLSGDLPAVLGVRADGPGVVDWCNAGHDLAPDSLDQLVLEVSPQLRLLPLGRGVAGTPHDPPDLLRDGHAQADLLIDHLRTMAGHVVVDAGTAPTAFGRRIASHSERSALVTRACYLSLRRFHDFPLRPTDVVLVCEPGRSLRAADVGAATGTRVIAEVPVDRSISRTVDAGLLHTRIPRLLRRPLWPAEAA